MAGEILKKRREDLGRDIREIADLLKIKADYLAAIEDDTFAKLPPPVYTMGYIRSYAKYLDVDAESIIHYYTDYSKNLSQPEHTTIIPVAYSQKKSPKIYYVALLLACAAAAFFFYRSSPLTGRKDAAKVPAGTPQVVVTAHSGVSKPLEAKGEIAVSENGPDIAASDAATGRKDAAKVPAGTPQVVVTGHSGISKPPEAKGEIAVNEHSLDIAASDTTWISVKFMDGKTEEMLLRPGDSKSLIFSDKLLMKIGNAGGIRVNLDGKDLGVPGVSGQVITLSLPVQ